MIYRYIMTILLALSLFCGCEINMDSDDGSVSINDTPTLLTSFYFDASNPENGLQSDAIGEINGAQVVVVVPHGTDTTSLVPTVISQGTSISIPTDQPNDFSKAVPFTITDAEGNSEQYYVFVNEAGPGSKDILSYEFRDAGVKGTINGTEIIVIVPEDMDLSGMTPWIRHNGASITCLTENPVFAPGIEVDYVVYASDGSSKEYSVFFRDEVDTAKEILSFRFPSIPDAAVIINSNEIIVNLLEGTPVTSLAPEIVFVGESVSPASGAVEDFSSPVTYVVTAMDGTKKTYTVTVNLVPSSVKVITSFTLAGVTVAVPQNATDIRIEVPYGTDLRYLQPEIVYQGRSISPAPNVYQDFRSAIVYTVTANDGTRRQYTVTASVKQASGKSITGFSLMPESIDEENEGIRSNINGEISNSGSFIKICVPREVNILSLRPTILLGSDSISVRPASGQVQDFSNPVYYTVRGGDGTSRIYTVIIEKIGITELSLDMDYNSFLNQDLSGIIDSGDLRLNQKYPAVYIADNRSLAIWESEYPYGAFDICAQISDALTGNLAGYGFTVNQGRLSEHTVPSVSVSGSRALAAWTAHNGSTVTIKARVIDLAAGRTTGTEIDVATVNAAMGSTCGVAMAEDTGVVVWNTEDGSNHVVRGRLIDISQGTAQTGIITISDSDPVVKLNPQISPVSSSMEALVAWNELNGGNASIVGQVIDLGTGNVTGGQIEIDSITNGSIDLSQVALSGDTGIIALAEQSTSNYVMKCSLVDMLTGSVNNLTVIDPDGFQESPQVQASNGRALMVWGDDSASETVVRAQLINVASRALSGGVITLVDQGVQGGNPRVAVSGARGLVTWEERTSATAKNISARFVDMTAGSLVGSVFQVNDTGSGDRTCPSVALDQSRALVSWSDHGESAGSTWNILAQTVELSGTSGYSLTGDSTVYDANTALHISATIPDGSPLTGIRPTIKYAGDSITPVSLQARNFTYPVHYTVADNGGFMTRCVVDIAHTTDKRITFYSFRAEENRNAFIYTDVLGTISDNVIEVLVPFDTNLSALVATFVLSDGAHATVGSSVQTSGLSANNFGSDVVYTVTGSDGASQNYTVRVKKELDYRKEITSFGFYTSDGSNSGMIQNNAVGEISGSSIRVKVPEGTNFNGLTARIGFEGQKVLPDPALARDFSAPVTYTVFAKNGTQRNYTVIVEYTLLMKEFGFKKADNVGGIDDVKGRIKEDEIIVKVPYGTDVTNLAANFVATEGARVSVNEITQVSNTTRNSFMGDVIYTVSNDYGSIKRYTVTVMYEIVYIGGSYNEHACYWKNEDRIDLSNSDDSIVKSIIFNGDDLYAVGIDSNSTGLLPPIACYWKNGQRIDLPFAVTERALGFCVSNSDVYLAGVYNTDSNGWGTPCYWKNGMRHDLTLPEAYGASSMVYTIDVSGEDMRVAGVSQNNGVHTLWIWKNNQASALYSFTAGVYIFTMAISGDDLYCGGLANINGQYYSMSKNSELIRLTLAREYWGGDTDPSSLLHLITTNIYIDENRVYSAGLYTTEDEPYPYYSVDGIWYPVAGTGSLSIFAVENDIYLLGSSSWTNNGISHEVDGGARCIYVDLTYPQE